MLATPRLLTLRETAARLGVSVDTVRRLVARGEIPAVQLGGPGSSVRVDPDDLETWLEQNLIGGDAA